MKGRYKWREFELDELSEILDIICDYPISETLALKVAIGILKLKPELIPMFRRKYPTFFDKYLWRDVLYKDGKIAMRLDEEENKCLEFLYAKLTER